VFVEVGLFEGTREGKERKREDGVRSRIIASVWEDGC
jgi:hypothetical protein